MWLVVALLKFSQLGAALLAPLVAAFMVYRIPKPRYSPLANWLGLTLGYELGVAFFLFALSVALRGPTHWAFYYAAYAIAAGAPMLGYVAAREHLRHLRGHAAATRWAGHACLGMAVLVAVGLIPWILGAPLPFGGSWFGAEVVLAGDVRNYASVVLPFTAAMEVEAWLLMHRPSVAARAVGPSERWKVWSVSVGVAMLAVGAILLLPDSRWNSRRIAKVERAVLREQAERQDVPRRRALAEIVAGHVPSFYDNPCPEEWVPDSWRAWRRFVDAPRDWNALLGQAEAWESLDSVNLRRYGKVAEDAFPGALPRFAGPRRRAVFTRLDDKNWTVPWPERDFLVAPEEVRRRVRAAAALDSGEIDGTLLVWGEAKSYSIQDHTYLGTLAGTLWVWSYREQAFVCAGKADAPPAGMKGGFYDPQAATVRDAIRMRALARAVAALRPVVRRP